MPEVIAVLMELYSGGIIDYLVIIMVESVY